MHLGASFCRSPSGLHPEPRVPRSKRVKQNLVPEILNYIPLDFDKDRTLADETQGPVQNPKAIVNGDSNVLVLYADAIALALSVWGQHTAIAPLRGAAKLLSGRSPPVVGVLRKTNTWRRR